MEWMMSILSALIAPYWNPKGSLRKCFSPQRNFSNGLLHLSPSAFLQSNWLLKERAMTLADKEMIENIPIRHCCYCMNWMFWLVPSLRSQRSLKLSWHLILWEVMARFGGKLIWIQESTRPLSKKIHHQMCFWRLLKRFWNNDILFDLSLPVLPEVFLMRKKYVFYSCKALIISDTNSCNGIARYFSQLSTSCLSTPAANFLSFNFFLTEL